MSKPNKPPCRPDAFRLALLEQIGKCILNFMAAKARQAVLRRALLRVTQHYRQARGSICTPPGIHAIWLMASTVSFPDIVGVFQLLVDLSRAYDSLPMLCLLESLRRL